MGEKGTGIYLEGFFYIFYEVYIYKQKVVVTEIPKLKLKTILARNTIFEGN